MYVFAAKILDHLGNPFPFSGHGSIVGAADRWHHWDVRCYDNVMKALRYIRIPTVQNQVPEATKWYGRQPAHLLRADCYWAPNFISQRFAHHKPAHWDGTQNMPIFRLADPKHKDSFMVQFRWGIKKERFQTNKKQYRKFVLGGINCSGSNNYYSKKMIKFTNRNMIMSKMNISVN